MKRCPDTRIRTPFECPCATSSICSCLKVVCAVDSNTTEEDTCGDVALHVSHCGDVELALKTSIDSKAMSYNKEPIETLQSPIWARRVHHPSSFDFRQAKWWGPKMHGDHVHRKVLGTSGSQKHVKSVCTYPPDEVVSAR
jgi:hypothetical protein